MSRRVLVVDDNRSIHEDFRKVLAPPPAAQAALDDLEARLFGGDGPSAPTGDGFEVDSAFQGEEGLERVRRACSEGRPYAVAFVDMRMPPGWDGLETIDRLWKVDPELQVVICTAYSDHSWSDIVARLGQRDGLLILKKPFDNVEVHQIAHSMVVKWRLQREVEQRLADLETLVRGRTYELEEANARLRTEMAERQRVESELRMAQKLEAIGQLAAGIAHEINTPIQYLGDSLYFLRGAFEDLSRSNARTAELALGLASQFSVPEVEPAVSRIREEGDLDYLAGEVPKALERAGEATLRVSAIVSAMKEFGRPDHREMAATDLNRAISATLTVANNEYKYVAELVTELGELPPVTCHVGELQQVILNLVVNAAHAIADVVGQWGTRGTLTVRTRLDAAFAVIEVQDTGGGIPEAIRHRVFDPFFTTKEVGKGTGQGLAIARAIVVDKHKGSIGFETEVGRGTTFRLRIPIGGQAGVEVATAAPQSAA